MSEPMHKDLTGVNIHVIHAYEYADEAARLAATGFLSTDVGKCALQLDTKILYVLTDEDPITWAALGVSGGDSGTFYGVDASGASVAIVVTEGVITSIG